MTERCSPRAVTGAIAGVLAAMLPAATAQAIECNGRYQIVQGSELSTPYCEDNYLASVARQYGSTVSARAIRNNPNLKAETCRFMGHDTRVSDICAPYRGGSGRPIF